jgi:PAS domain S-box-containing protein
MSNFSINEDSQITQLELKKLLVAIEQSANTILITNDKAEIEYVNPYFTQLTGYKTDEVIGKNPRLQKSGFHDHNFYEQLWSTISKGEKWVGEFYNKKKNGDFYWESATISPITDNNGKITNYLAVKEDITERKLQQKALEQSELKLKELNATKDKFFSIIAHDMMNPVNALLGFSSLALESISNMDFEKSLKYTSMIDQLSNQISGLFQNLLLWSRAQSGNIRFQPVQTNISELITESISILVPMAQKKEISISVSASENLSCNLDRNMIETVVRNLVQNAIKFSYPHNMIKITAEEVENKILISIVDHGTGMSPSVLNNLFSIDKAQSQKGTENESGTGLGLIVCKEFIHLHKGEIRVISEPEKGSTFFISLPK